MDEVIGIAILTRTKPQELWVVCRKANGNSFMTVIPAYGVGDPKPAEHAWLYQIVGDVLHITPSLHVRYQLPTDVAVRKGAEEWVTRFHNGYNWSVKFKWADATDTDEVRREAREANRDITFSHEL